MARTKYGMQYCAYCRKDARMELVGEMQGAKDKIWYRCTRCHHMSLVDVSTHKNNGKSEKLDAANATVYDPQLSFTIGEAIYHTDWDDVGKVVSKAKTSNGSQAIVVSFEKQGQRRLIENLKPDVSADIISPKETV